MRAPTIVPTLLCCFTGWTTISESFDEGVVLGSATELPDDEAEAVVATAGFFSFIMYEITRGIAESETAAYVKATAAI